jgi:hypothetical protein
MNVGDLVYIKTTGETGFIVEEENREATVLDAVLGKEFKVRVPLATRDGIQHMVRNFYEAELEVFSSKIKRNAQEVLAELLEREKTKQEYSKIVSMPGAIIEKDLLN